MLKKETNVSSWQRSDGDRQLLSRASPYRMPDRFDPHLSTSSGYQEPPSEIKSCGTLFDKFDGEFASES